MFKYRIMVRNDSAIGEVISRAGLIAHGYDHWGEGHVLHGRTACTTRREVSSTRERQASCTEKEACTTRQRNMYYKGEQYVLHET